MKAKILGVMKFVDDGEVDDKIICVPADDRNNGDKYQKLEDLPKQLINQIEFHFNHYKDLKKPGTTKVKAFEGVKEAKAVIKASIERFLEAHPDVKFKKGVEDAVEQVRSAVSETIDAAKKAMEEPTKQEIW